MSFKERLEVAIFSYIAPTLAISVLADNDGLELRDEIIKILNDPRASKNLKKLALRSAEGIKREILAAAKTPSPPNKRAVGIDQHGKQILP